MAAAAKKIKIERDRFTEDGVRLFNPTKDHGVVYADGYVEVKYIQEYEGEERHYRGDHAPVGYAKGVPMPKSAPELLTENEQLQNRIKDLEDSQRRTNELLTRLSAQLDDKAKDRLEPGQAPEPTTYASATKPVEAAARGAVKPK
jgi:hypothetical protein